MFWNIDGSSRKHYLETEKQDKRFRQDIKMLSEYIK